MTAFVASNGLDNFFDAYTGGSINATLDTYTISNQSRLVIRTDSNACINHSVAFGSLDTVTFSGTGGTLHFDPTNVRVIAYTAGTGVSPAFGATITQGGVSGVFLGAWTNWSSECIVPGAAIGAAGFIKIGSKVGGNFAAGVLTGITANCSGPDVQGWMEVRGDTIATITVPRIGKVTSTEAWFELGTTTGVRGQILACPTCATAAGTFPGVWIETSAGSGIYEKYIGVGSQVALATTATDVRGKFIWSTVTGIRIGNDGTNAVGFLPPAGCKVRIPAIILTNSTRTVSGTGPRVLPNATIATRQEFITTGAGYFDLRGIVSQWYMNFSQAFYVKYKSCAINDSMILSEIASPLDVDDCIVTPTQAQLNLAANFASCFAGGTINNTIFARFSLATASSYSVSLNYLTGVSFSNVGFVSLTLRANATTGVITSTQLVNCTFTNCVGTGSTALFIGAQNCTFTNYSYYDHTITTTTTATNPNYALQFTNGSAGTIIDGFLIPSINHGPYSGIVGLTASYATFVKNIGTFASPVNCNNLARVIVAGLGNNDGIKMKRCYAIGTATGPYSFVNSDTNILIENCAGDYADTGVLAGLNAIVKNCALTDATTGQISVYGSIWKTRFISATAGFAEIACNEPTASSSSQCYESGGTPQFNSSGSVLLTKVGDSITWEMPFFAIGYTAFTNTNPTVTGTGATFVSGANYTNHTIEYQFNAGAGWNGTWLPYNAASLITQTFNSTSGFKLKIRATCTVANATNALTNIRTALTTTSVDQSTQLYPLTTNTVSFTGLPTGCDVVVLTAGTTTVLEQIDSLAATTYNYTFSGAQNIDIGFINPGYVPYYIRNIALTATDSEIPVALTIDRNYA